MPASISTPTTISRLPIRRIAPPERRARAGTSTVGLVSVEGAAKSGGVDLSLFEPNRIIFVNRGSRGASFLLYHTCKIVPRFPTPRARNLVIMSRIALLDAHGVQYSL